MTTTSAPFDLATVNLTDAEIFRHGFPHELFTHLREEAPVWRHPAVPGMERFDPGFWVLSKHADVQAVSRDFARFSSHDGPMVPDMPPERQGTMIVTMEPPEHTRVRRLISAGFTPRMVAKLDDQARTWSASIVEAALERGECDFVQDIAALLPMHMIADIMGIPVSDRAWLFDRISRSSRASDPQLGMSVEERTNIELEVFNYAHELGTEKRRCPADDVWTILTDAEITTDAGERTRLTELELDLLFQVLTVAGSETSREAMTAGLIALLDNRDQLERMRNEPEVMPSAVEEIIRWASPADYFRRTATEDVEIRGVKIAAGDKVAMFYPSANRDEDVFPDPFRFDITRKNNPHVSFGGGGVHYCLGANLAKREVSVMYDELLKRVGDIEILAEPVYSASGLDSAVACAIIELPVRLTAL